MAVLVALDMINNNQRRARAHCSYPQVPGCTVRPLLRPHFGPDGARCRAAIFCLHQGRSAVSHRIVDLGPFPAPELLAFHEIMQRHRSSKKDAEAQIISEVIGLQIVQKGENKEMARCHCADEP